MFQIGDVVYSNLPKLEGKLLKIIDKKWDYFVCKRMGKPRESYEILDVDLKAPDTPVLANMEKRGIVDKLVKEQNLKGVGTWARELKIFNQLYDKYPNPYFWREFSLDFELNSLAWLKGDGAKDLDSTFNAYFLDFPIKEQKLEENKVGNDIVIDKKQTVMEWLK